MPGEWIVLFCGAPRRERRWWHRLLGRARLHVMALRAEGPQSLVINPEGLALRVTVEPMDVEDLARGLMLTPGWDWAEVEALRILLPDVPTRPLLRGPATCVEVVKMALGIVAPWCLTPAQLRRLLIRRGARPVSPVPA
jgi:hypothetical protein